MKCNLLNFRRKTRSELRPQIEIEYMKWYAHLIVVFGGRKLASNRVQIEDSCNLLEPDFELNPSSAGHLQVLYRSEGLTMRKEEVKRNRIYKAFFGK